MGRGSDEFWHVFVEAKKMAFADRARFYADPKFVDVPVKWLISGDYAAVRRPLIGEKEAMKVDPGVPPGGDTISLPVAATGGMMVRPIQSTYRGPGSGRVTGTGDRKSGVEVMRVLVRVE